MNEQSLIVVAGATGRQGGAVVDHLLKSGAWKVRGLTRHPESAAARALSEQGRGDGARRPERIPTPAAHAAGRVWGVQRAELLGSGHRRRGAAGQETWPTWPKRRT